MEIENIQDFTTSVYLEAKEGGGNKSMQTLVRTRLFPPARVGGSMRRERLALMIDAIRQKPLTVVRAPAGFGKSTVLTQWFDDLRDQGEAVGWISLDKAADDLASFLHYVVEAIRGSRPHFGAHISAFLQGMGRMPVQGGVAAIINDVLAEDAEIFLFIDDFNYVIDSELIAVLAEIMAHPPANFHLILASRHSLPFSLSRLRLKGGLAEIEVESLRFDSKEAADFLHAAGHATLAPVEIETLMEKTEGWIAGIQLASISLEKNEDVWRFVSRLSGDYKHISGYLADDVLSNIDQMTAEFMMVTSILPRLCADLCDAVTGLGNARQEILNLESHGLFLFSLDSEGVWYRYHHLFARFLQRRLADKSPLSAFMLHKRACDWFADNGMMEDAFNHAIEGGDVMRAAELLDQYCSTLMYGGGNSTLLRWARQIPASILRNFPRPRLEIAFSLILEWRFDEAATIIGEVEAALSLTDVLQEGQGQGLTLSHIVAHRKMVLHHFMDNAGQAEAVTSSISRDFPDDDPYLRGNLETCSIYANREMYRFDGIDRMNWTARDYYHRFNSNFVLVWHDTVMGPTCFHRGDAELAINGLNSAVEAAENLTGRFSSLAAMPALILAEILYEQNQVERAADILRDYGPEAEKQGFVDHLVSYYVTKIRLAAMRGDDLGVASALRLGRGLAERHGFSRLRHFIDHEAIRLAVLANDLDTVKRFRAGMDDDAIERVSKPGGRTTTGDEALALSWCRACSALGDHNQAITILRRWTAFLANRGAVRSEVRMLVFLSVVLARDGRDGEALRTLHAAVRKAARPRLIRSFLDEGGSVEVLLRRLSEGGEDVADATIAFGLSLLKNFAACGDAGDDGALVLAAGDADAPLLPEQFNRREAEVMKLVAAGQSNKEIGNRLGLTEGMVKWYLQQAFEKLGVRRRSLAVMKARKFGII